MGMAAQRHATVESAAGFGQPESEWMKRNGGEFVLASQLRFATQAALIP